MLDWLRNLVGLDFPGQSAAEAFAAHESGDWERAARLLQPLAAARPDDVRVHYRLGDALYRLDRLPEALPHLERAAALDGGVAAHHYKLGYVLMTLERPEEALRHYARALEIEPGHAQALNNTGTILETQGRTEEALRRYRQAVAADPKLEPAHNNLAQLLHRSTRFAEAVEAYQALLEVAPRSEDAWCNLGNAYIGLERIDEAVRCYERAIEYVPDSALAHYRLSVALLEQEQYPQAEAAARRATALAPAHVESWINLGNALQAQNRFDDALAAYEQGLRLSPAIPLPELLNNLGTTNKHKGALDTALRHLERAVEVAPQFTLARFNLATTRYFCGWVRESIAGLREVLERDPQNANAARHLLMSLLYLPTTNDDLFAEHLAFAERFAHARMPAPRWTPRRPDGKLRIGYVSSDFRRHPVGYNLLPVIRSHDRGRFEIYLYSNVRQSDSLTRWFREQATAWRSITQLSDEKAAQLVREDEVDILVLLAGRFDDNRPLLALHRAAPLQVSMHDPATSGLKEMDYLIADRNLSPRRTTEKFTERVVCLPTFYLHAPMNDVPLSPEPPCVLAGRITFGSFNNPAKINESVVALWAEVLKRVPGSRLLLKYAGVFASPSVRARYAGLFREHGIGDDRLILSDQPREERASHLTHYARIDIALDTFPFSGSTTTFEALWMGIPVITLAGERMVSRWSAAMLRKAGLRHLIALNEADYVEIAAKLASSPDEIVRLRRELRDRVARSPLCAEAPRARQLERLFRRMWAMHCAKQGKT